MQAWVKQPLLADGATAAPLVVVGRVDKHIFGQLEQLAEETVVLGTRVPVLEVRPAGSTASAKQDR